MTEQALADEWVDEMAEYYTAEADYVAVYLLDGPGPEDGLRRAA
jgi:hypothetical protein